MLATDGGPEARGLSPRADALPLAVGIPIPPPPQVVAEETIPGTLELERWRTTGPVQLTVSEMTAPGSQASALRAEVDLSYEAQKVRSYTAWLLDFAEPQDWSAYNRLLLNVFVEPSATPRGASISVILYAEDQPRRTLGPWIIPRGTWHEALWDLTPVPRERITTIMVVRGVHCHNPGEADRAVYHLGGPALRRVEPATKFHGWELQPHRVAFSHVGYPPDGEKTAIFPDGDLQTVQLMEAETGNTAWEGELRAVSHPRTGRFLLADFSEVRQPGRYVLLAEGKDGPLASEPFFIGPEVYADAVREVFNFYRAERCGCEAPGYHTACHLDDGIVEPYAGMDPERFAPEVRAIFGKHVDCTGGWHDAGDCSKFAYQEYNSAYQMFRLYERGLRYARGEEPRDAILDEAIWGVEYALRTLLPTGRDCDRPERVGLRKWTDCIPGNEDDRQVGLTTWQSIERYVRAVAAEAIAARMLHESDAELAERCLAQARAEAEAYLTGAMKDWREKATVIKYSSVGTSFLELYRATHDQRYAEAAARCGDELVACQEQSLAWNDLGITGFFYEGPERSYPYGGGGGDGRQAYFLAELCRELPDHPSCMSWYAALRIYVKFYALRTAEHLTPYGVPAFCLHDGPEQPRRYWEMVHVLGEKTSQRLDYQFERLVRVGERYLIRIRGANPALSMHAAALAAAADVCDDPQAEAMAHRCLQWILGRNPFSRSQVWAVGYRYREQPHYVAMHDEMPGSIGCRGIDGRLDGDGTYHDEPYSDPLPRCVINEVHIAASARFLNAGRELALSPTLSGTVHGGERPQRIVARFAGTQEIVARAAVSAEGEYELRLPGGGTYELQCGSLRRVAFIASAAERKGFDFDLEREVEVSVTCPDQVAFGEPFTARVEVRRLAGRAADQAAAPHVLSLRLHNLECAGDTLTVELAGKTEATVEFELVPERPSEPFLVLVVPDGQLDKRAEAIGVVGPAG